MPIVFSFAFRVAVMYIFIYIYMHIYKDIGKFVPLHPCVPVSPKRSELGSLCLG
jgi:hypothetical protein